MEKIGIYKRKILVDRIQGARDAQEDAKEEFQSALEQFLEVVSVENQQLEKTYKRLNEKFEKSESRAREVSDRLDKVEAVSKALFKEWRAELHDYKNRRLRDVSAAKLDATQDKYDAIIVVMRSAEEKMLPVLSAFRDQVLFLKHNLNANAIASIQSEAVAIEKKVVALIEEMEASILEADAFIAAMNVSEAE